MSGDIHQLNELFNLNQNLGSSEPDPTPDYRVQAFHDAVVFQDAVNQESKKSQTGSQKTFWVMAGSFMLSAILMLIGTLPLMTDVGDVGNVLMVASVIFGGIYTAKRLIPTPLYRLKERADDLMNNVSKIAPRRTAPKFLPKKPRRKVILGVGSFIAEKTDIAPEVVRAAMVIMAFLSAGTVIPAYFITGFILNAVQKDLRNNAK